MTPADMSGVDAAGLGDTVTHESAGRREQQQRLGALDGLRGVAAAAVFAFHYGGGQHAANPALRVLGTVSSFGWLGVPLFFVLSGFLITRNVWDRRNEPHRARRFYLRRALRIFPLYYLALGLVFAGAIAWGTARGAVPGVAVVALFLQNVPGLSNRAQTIPSPFLVHHFWTLAVEMQFYLLWPWMVWRQRSLDELARTALFVVAAAFLFRCVCVLHGASTAIWSETLPARAGELAAGAWLAARVHVSPQDGGERGGAFRAAPAGRWMLVAGAIGGLAVIAARAPLLARGDNAVAYMLLAISGGTVLSAASLGLALQPGIWERVLQVRALRMLGTISFGVYVFHILLREFFWKVTHHFAPASAGLRYFAIRFAVACSGTLLAAVLSYVLLERPALRRKRHVAP